MGRVVSPEPEDFYTAGQMVAMYTRRSGQMALRDHAQDILIALGAWHARAELSTVNRQDMERLRCHRCEHAHWTRPRDGSYGGEEGTRPKQHKPPLFPGCSK